MKPLSLRLRGFIGIKKGMGQDELALDLSGLSGLIAFDGKNGRGKSTILDNLHPFRTLASRDGSLAHHVFLRDSFKEFAFELGGHKYNTLVKIDSHSGKQEGYVWKDGAPQVSGKATEYDKYIEGLLGSPKLFFQSVFAAQGGDSLADMTTGDLKGLFAEFLQLDVLAAHEETAKQAVKAIDQKVDKLDAQGETLRERLTEGPRIAEQIEAAEAKLGTLTADIEKKKPELEACAKQIEDLSQAVIRHNSAYEKMVDLNKKIAAEKDRLQAETEKTREALGECETKHRQEKGRLEQLEETAAKSNRPEIEKAVAFCDTTLAELDQEVKVANNEAVATRKDIENRRNQMQEKSERARELISRMEKGLAEKREVYQGVTDRIKSTQQEIEGLKNNREIDRLEQQINTLKDRAAKLDQRDPECRSETCVFIRDAVTARNTLPQKEGKLAEMRGENEQKIKTLEDAVEESAQDRAAITEAAEGTKRQIREVFEKAEADEQKRLSFINELTESLHKVETFINETQEKIDQTKTEKAKLTDQLKDMPDPSALAADIATAKEKVRFFEQEQKKLRNHIAEKQSDAAAEIAALEKEKDELESTLDPEAEKALTDAKQKRERLAGEINDMESTAVNCRSELAVLKHQAEEIAKTEDALADIEARKKTMMAERSEWAYIQNACGKNGLQALEIDGTAPLIAGHANDLLTETFGPGSTVGFRTINDDGKECLDIVVYRDDDAGEDVTLLENLSGGQKVWILKALRLALTLVSKAKSGKDIAAALSDEEDGALDAEAAVSFISLYRAFMAAGGFAQCIYITHRDECKAMADHVIRLTDKGVVVDSNVMAKAA